VVNAFASVPGLCRPGSQGRNVDAQIHGWLRTDFTTRRHCGWVDHPPNACVWWTDFSQRARFLKKMNNGKITLAGQVVSAGDRLLVRAFTDSTRGVRASGR